MCAFPKNILLGSSKVSLVYVYFPLSNRIFKRCIPKSWDLIPIIISIASSRLFLTEIAFSLWLLSNIFVTLSVWGWKISLWVQLNNQSSLIAQLLKNQPAMQETRVQSPGREDPLEKEMTTHSSILAWKIPWSEEPVGYSLWGCKSLTRLSYLD